MQRRSHYHALHWLQLDTLAVMLLAGIGWLLWPRVPHDPHPSPRRALPPPSVAYRYAAEERIVRSLRYPGHFAFATPIGFGAEHPHPQAADRHWTLAGVRPYLPPDPLFSAERHRPARPAMPLVWPPRPAAPTDRGTLRPPAARPFWAVEPSASLECRELRVPSPEELALAPGMPPSGDVLAHLRVAPHGRVDAVVFSSAEGLTWDVLQHIERRLLRSDARRAAGATSGWVRIRWCIPGQG